MMQFAVTSRREVIHNFTQMDHDGSWRMADGEWQRKNVYDGTYII